MNSRVRERSIAGTLDLDLPILPLVGRVSARARAAVASGLPNEASALEISCFASFSPATFPVGEVFDVILDAASPEAWAPTEAHLLAVTQQFGAPWAEVPAGWRTICVLRFPRGIPDVVAGLPVIDSWSQGAPRVALGKAETVARMMRP